MSEQPSLEPSLLPHMGTGLEKVAQTTLAPSNPDRIPQLAGHPITRSKTSQKSTKTCHAVWSMEREDTRGHHAQQQARANESHHRPRTLEIRHRHRGTQRDTPRRNWRPSGLAFFWSGKAADESRKASFGSAIRSVLIPKLETLPKGINDRLMTTHVPVAGNTHLTLISAYAHTPRR